MLQEPRLYNSELETICFVFRHKTKPKLVVSFRGTSSKKHWTSNLEFGKIPLDLYDMPLTELDLIDGLDVSNDTPVESEDTSTFPRESRVGSFSTSNKNRNSLIITRSNMKFLDFFFYFHITFSFVTLV